MKKKKKRKVAAIREFYNDMDFIDKRNDRRDYQRWIDPRFGDETDRIIIDKPFWERRNTKERNQRHYLKLKESFIIMLNGQWS